jgi:Spy/CpxP family protein refolding chaperone
MTSGKAIALLIALFLTGAVSGGFVGFNIARRQAAQVIVPADPPKPPPWQNGPRPGGRPIEKTRDRLARELELTDEQMVKIDPIITAFDAQLETMSKQNFNNLAMAISNRNEQIKPFLTPEQLQKLEERSKRRGPGGPPRHDGPSRDKESHSGQ